MIPGVVGGGVRAGALMGTILGNYDFHNDEICSR